MKIMPKKDFSLHKSFFWGTHQDRPGTKGRVIVGNTCKIKLFCEFVKGRRAASNPDIPDNGEVPN